MNYKSTISIKGHMYETLADIFPENGKLNILIIGKTPSFKSIVNGHYFQGTRGHYFWKKMNELGILKVPEGEYTDAYLFKNH